MNQEKIGKFIVEQRKIQKLTQEQLAEKLHVSKNAVSKWKRGLNLPDVSIMKDLCFILDITLNELFAGEKIKKEEYSKKTDESIVNAINYTNDKAKKKINKVMILGASLTLTLMLLFNMFIIDLRRISKNQPVVFSTWGFKYHPVVNLDEEMIDIAIKNYLIEKSDNELIYHNNQKAFVSMRVYLRDYSKTQINIYAWVLEEIYYL